MRCPACGHDNPEGMNFCVQCATPLTPCCPQCGFENPPGSAFCGQCATPLTGRQKGKRAKGEKAKREKISPESGVRSLESGPSLAVRATPEAERRQLTVMFCDLVGSTPLAEQLDPEELREVVRAYQEACAAVIHRFEGYIARYVGDALLVYFGYPVAHEDDAQRAVRAGLGIVAALPELNVRVQQTIKTTQALPLQVRIGIHTGLVVVGEMGGGDYREAMALGETPNIAARLQGMAEPDTVMISAATYRLIEGLFVYHALGPHILKGVSTPVEVYRVLEESGAQSRFEVAVRTGLTPLVGRDEELGLLLKRWERVKEGQGQVVLLSGEPGIGKSRLVQELKEQVAREGHTRIEFRCSPYYQNSAFYPVIEHLQRLLQFHRDDTPQEKLAKLERVLREYRLPLQEVVPLFASLLSLPHPDRYPPLSLSPQRQKQKTLEALVAWLVEAAERQLVLAAWEDLHWVDPSTLELLSLLTEQASTARLYLLLTSRPEFTPPWAPRSYLIQLTLGRLSRKQAEAMVEEVTGGKALPAEVVQQVASKTDGVPLFVEELTKTVIESVGATGRSPLPLAIPATLQDSLMARLDRLGPAKEVAQLGATLGREFSYELIQAVSLLDEETLQKGLTQLVEAELVYQRGLPPQARYLFKHALVQDAAYQSLLKSTRQQVHQQIARVLEGQFPDTVATQPELVAHHYTEAGLREQALPYWQRAGERAVQRSANAEAINHLTKALQVLNTLPATPERIPQELALQTLLGPALSATRGNAAPEVGQTYTRARELCQQVGETPQLFPVLFGLRSFHLVQGEVQTAHELGEQLLSLAQRAHDTDLLLEAHLALGNTSFVRGEFIPTRAHFEQSLALYDPQQHRSHAFLYGLDPGVFCLGRLAMTLWFLGYPDQALETARASLTLAQKVSHPYSVVMTILHAAWTHFLRREGRAVQERGEAAKALCIEQGFPHLLGGATLCYGWALVEQGEVDDGIAQIQQGLAACRATRAKLLMSFYPTVLAEACGKAEQCEMGLSVVAEALDVVQQNGEHLSEAELYRLKGELTLQQFNVQGSKFKVANPQHPTPSTQAEAEAEACFLQAIEIARRQEAKSLELRAVMSLSRLWQQQGKKEEAQQMLAEIYGWFTEGFDTADLKEAKALLDSLESSV